MPTSCPSGLRNAPILASPMSPRTPGLSIAHGDGKSRNGRDDRGRPARLEKQYRAYLRMAARACRAPRPVRGNVVRRPAADAGDRPRIGVLAKTSDAG